ncbi:hypothetical protein IFM89_029465 [Coptis chinensis]|uniref:DUF4216 domain-containing protein n=1 Tax=Coptis chinensis TaxID=261450 RepID=A0A835M138_9MAGN|nr:hypothetical protein IFM89_029465 [Coptis chinensis]
MDYIPWLRKQLEKEEMSRFKRLADGPSFSAKSYNSFSINGYVFSTYDSEVNMTTRNSRVSMKAFTNFRASAKDKNLVEDETTYYGIVKQILELDYHDFKEIVFFCDWVRIEDKRNGCYVDPDTNLVFDLSRDSWHVVLHTPKRLNHDADTYEDPLVFEAMENLDGSAALMGDIMEDDGVS